MIAFSITTKDAAKPDASLAFMFCGEGLLVFPLMLLPTAISLRVCGAVSQTSHYY